VGGGWTGESKNVSSTKVVILITFIASIWGEWSSGSSSKGKNNNSNMTTKKDKCGGRVM